jgi:hypothetical protein
LKFIVDIQKLLIGFTKMNSTSIHRAEHRYFTVAAACVTVTVLAGFIPLYTLRLLHHDANLTLLVHVHGLVMTAWIALFLSQTRSGVSHEPHFFGIFGSGTGGGIGPISVPPSFVRFIISFGGVFLSGSFAGSAFLMLLSSRFEQYPTP